MAFLFRGDTNSKESVNVSFKNGVINAGDTDFPIKFVSLSYLSKQEIVIYFKSYTLKITNEDLEFEAIYDNFATSKRRVILLSCIGSLLLLSLFYSLFSKSTDIAQSIPDKYFDFIVGKNELPDYLKDKICKVDPKLSQKFFNRIGVEDKYQLYVLNLGFDNAFAYPKDKIIFTESLVEKLNDDEFLAILGHELGHLHFKHYKSAVLRAVVLDFFGVGISSQLMTYFGSLSNSKHSRDAERQSDEFSAKLMINNNIDLRNNITAMEKISENSSEVKYLSFMSTHPLTSERIQFFKVMRQKSKKGNSSSSRYLVDKLLISCKEIINKN